MLFRSKNKEDIAEIFIDKKLLVDDVSWDNYKLIKKLAPFGVGNEKPLFLFENIELVGVKIFGKTKNHLELVFQNSRGGKIKAIDFFSKYIVDDKPTVKNEQKINFLANFEKNTYLGTNELRLRIVEIV